MTRMIAFDITKLTTEKFRQCTVHIKNVLLLLFCVLVSIDRSLSEALNIHTTTLIYRTRIVGRRQVTVRLMN